MMEALLDEIFHRIERKPRENICVQIYEFWAAGNLPNGLGSLAPIVQWIFTLLSHILEVFAEGTKR